MNTKIKFRRRQDRNNYSIRYYSKELREKYLENHKKKAIQKVLQKINLHEEVWNKREEWKESVIRKSQQSYKLLAFPKCFCNSTVLRKHTS